MLLICILIICFILLVGYQLIVSFYSKTNILIEGLETADAMSSVGTTPEYKPYNVNDPNNSLILAQQNSGNIEVLKGRIDGLDGIKNRVDTMDQSINLMQTQLNGLVQQQADYAQEMAGSSPPEITGTNEETASNVEASIEDENDDKL